MLLSYQLKIIHMRTLCKILMLFLPLLSFSQSYDSIEEEIISARPSKYELVFKARFLLIEALENSDKKAIQKFGSYLIRTHRLSNNPNLGADEIILLYFVNSDFENILSSIKSNPSVNYSFRYHLTTELRIKLINYLKANQSFFVSKIFLSHLKEDEKQFLKLYFDFELSNTEFMVEVKTLSNNSAKDFIEKFPQSPYTYYIRKFILVEKERMDWQLGMNLRLGWGIYSGDLAKKLANGINGLISMNVKPLADRVLVQPAEAEEKTASGIIIPDTAKEKPMRGTVVAAGPGKKDEPTTVKVGDTVLYGKYSGTEIQVEGKDFLMMRESDIFAIV
jgi:chaperonin GroES